MRTPVTGACSQAQVRGRKFTEAATCTVQPSTRRPGHEQIEVSRAGSVSTMGAAVELGQIPCPCSGRMARPEISDAVTQLLPYYAPLDMGQLRHVQ